MVAESVSDQSQTQPFVVCKTGETKTGGKFPLRECEQLTQGESLYWCVGGKQVGKAALQFWHDTLLPLRTHFGERLAVWPFEGIDGREVVVAECYPAILYRRVWGRRITKTNPCDVVDAVYEKMRQNQICCDKTWLHACSSEDEFDMFTTAMAVAAERGNPSVLLREQTNNLVRTVEGWMMLLGANE